LGRKVLRGQNMATLEKRGDSYRLIFYYQNVRFTRSLKTDKEKKALKMKLRLEGNLALLEQGRLAYEPGKDDLPTLLLTDGKLNARPEAAKRMTLGEFFDDYLKNLPPDKEKSTRYTEGIHVRHLRRIIGDKTPLVEVSAKLQEYVNTRHAEKTRQGEPVSHTTIKKELGTLTAVWNRWGVGQGHITGTLTLRNVGYPKKKEKAPFQTWDQVERKTKGDPESELWGSVYLSVPETEALLQHVRAGASLVRGHERQFRGKSGVFSGHCQEQMSAIVEAR
jgi:hypothetical protein